MADHPGIVNSFTLPFTRLFNNRIKPCIFDNLFSRLSKLFNISYLGNKSISKVFGNSLYRGENIGFIRRPFLIFFVKKNGEFFNLAFKEKDFLGMDRRDFLQRGHAYIINKNCRRRRR
ncbi:hypothetical protein [Caldimicrobium thiodismutans]|uniref:hypothetical protein n=1 Tax=Caldimicrobium thiodismutans TaxID=1653476 RepID=UPI0008399555|nr:hypothetical protein [Caldimicrobium thiodismutans]